MEFIEQNLSKEYASVLHIVTTQRHFLNPKCKGTFFDQFFHCFDTFDFSNNYLKECNEIDGMCDLSPLHLILTHIVKDKMIEGDVCSAKIEILHTDTKRNLSLGYIHFITVAHTPTKSDFDSDGELDPYFFDDAYTYENDNYPHLCLINDEQLFNHNFIGDYSEEPFIEYSFYCHNHEPEYHHW